MMVIDTSFGFSFTIRSSFLGWGICLHKNRKCGVVKALFHAGHIAQNGRAGVILHDLPKTGSHFLFSAPAPDWFSAPHEDTCNHPDVS